MINLRKVLTKILVIVSILIPSISFSAPLYMPGETLNPTCFPTDPDCTVSTSTAALTYTSFTYASSTFPSFTYGSTTYYLASNPNGYLTLSTASSSFPTFDYASSTYLSLDQNNPQTTSGILNFPSFNISSTTGGYYLNNVLILKGDKNLHNYFIGESGNATATGANNFSFGVDSLLNVDSGSGNIAIGAGTLRDNTSGGSNIAFGSGVLVYNTTGYGNIGIGPGALLNNTIGSSNIALGSGALANSNIGNNNLAVGNGALSQNATGSNNIAFGSSALSVNTEGQFNTAFGLSALSGNTIGEYNLAFGLSALPNNTTGSNNIAIGRGTGGGITTGSGNLIIGSDITGLDTTTTNNIILASGAGIMARNDGTNWDLTGNLNVEGDITSKGNVWVSQTAAESNSWNSVAYGDGKFVAVSSDGTHEVMTSSDGINWVPQTAAEQNGWSSITYGNGLFVAVSWNGTHRVMTSPDGINWSAHTATEQNNWASVTYGDGKFVAVSGNGTHQVMTSFDGITWEAQTSSAGNTWDSITYGNGLFVAVSAYGTGGVMTSTDGVNWASQTPAETSNWKSVTYGNGLFVAVADSLSGGSTHRIMTSPDGINWTSRTAPAANLWNSVIYGNGVFVAVSVFGTEVMISTDGINWTMRGTTEGNYWNSITYGNGTFVAVASNGTHRVITSGKNELNVVATKNNYQGGMSIFGNIGAGTSTPGNALSIIGDTGMYTSAGTILSSYQTSSTTPYTITAHEEYAPDVAIWMAMDGDDSTRWSSSSGGPGWIKIDFGVGGQRIANGMVLKPFAGQLENWTLSGSNDDSNWDVLDTGIHDASDSKVTYNFSNTTSYRYYKLDMPDNYAGYTGLWTWDLLNSGGSLTNYFSRLGATVFNVPSSDSDFQIKSVNNPNIFYVDASANAIGIGTSTPSQALTVVGSGLFTTDITTPTINVNKINTATFDSTGLHMNRTSVDAYTLAAYDFENNWDDYLGTYNITDHFNAAETTSLAYSGSYSATVSPYGYFTFPSTLVDSLASASSHTIEGWIYFHNPSGNNNQEIMDGQSGSDAFSWLWYAEGSGYGTNQMEIRLNNTITVVPWASYSEKWTHVAMVFDGSVTKLYLDGAFILNLNGGTTNYIKPSTSGGSLGIGNYISARTNYCNYDDFVFSNTARSTFPTTYQGYSYTYKVTNLADPTDAHDAVTKGYLENNFLSYATATSTSGLVLKSTGTTTIWSVNNLLSNIFDNSKIVTEDNGAISFYNPDTVTDLTPTMTSDVTPSGTTTCSSVLYSCYNAFDDNPSTLWHSDNTGAPHYIQYQFDTAQVVSSYTLRPRFDPNWAWSEWTLQASNDGINYTILDTEATQDIINNAQIASTPSEKFNFVNTTSYIYYKFVITKTTGGNNYAAMAEIELLPQASASEVMTLQDGVLDVKGGLRLRGDFFDSTNATGTVGMVLKSTGTSTIWGTNNLLADITGLTKITTEATTSDNAIRFYNPSGRDDLTPTMTSDTSPNGTTTCSSILGATSNCFNAFDDEPTGDPWHSANTGQPYYIQYQFVTPQVVNKYTLQLRSGYGYANWTDWTLQASNDGTNYTIIDTRAGVAPFSDGNKHTFTFSNIDYYTYYKFVITGTRDGQYAAADEIELTTSEAMTLKNGMLGIGTTTPSNVLTVDGNIFTTGSLIAGGNNLGVVVTPTMTSNTAPSGTTTCSSVYSPYDCYMAFDNDAQSWWNSNGTESPSWIQYEFPSAQKVNKYTITPRQNYGGNLGWWIDWTLQGSNDGIVYTIVDTRTGQDLSGNGTKTFNFTNNTPYTYYKFVITYTNGGTDYSGAAEIRLMWNTPALTILGDSFIAGTNTVFGSTTISTLGAGLVRADANGTLYTDLTRYATIAESSKTAFTPTNPLFDWTQPPTIVKTLTVPNATDYGTWDGEHLWLSSYDDHKLFEVSSDGVLMNTYDLGLNAYPVAMAYDGRYIWVGGGDGSGHLFKFDTVTGTTTAVYLKGSGAGAGGVQDVLWDGTYIWVGIANDNNVQKLDPNTGATLATSTGQTGVNGLTVTYLPTATGTEEYIWAANYGFVSKIRASDMTYSTSSSMVGGNPYAYRLTTDGKYVYSATWGGGGNVQKFDASSTAKVSSWNSGGLLNTIAFDGKYIWTADDGEAVNITDRNTGELVYNIPNAGRSSLVYDGGDYMWSISRTSPGVVRKIYIGNKSNNMQVSNSLTIISDTSTSSSVFLSASSTGSSYIMSKLGIGTTTPTANLTIAGTPTSTLLRLVGIGAGSLTSDASGNIMNTSDERLKDIEGNYTRGLAEIKQLTPINYKWKAETGLDASSTYSGFSAQNVQSVIPEAVGENGAGFLTLSDRPILAAVVNAVKEIASFITKIQDGIAYLTNIVVERFTVGSIASPTGITMYDRDTNEPYCVSIRSGVLFNEVGECSNIVLPVSSGSSAPIVTSIEDVISTSTDSTSTIPTESTSTENIISTSTPEVLAPEATSTEETISDSTTTEVVVTDESTTTEPIIDIGTSTPIESPIEIILAPESTTTTP